MHDEVFSFFFLTKKGTKTPVLVQFLNCDQDTRTYRPPSRAGTVSSDVVARSSILAGATLLAVKTVATGGAPLATTVTNEFHKKRHQTSILLWKQGLKHRGMKEMLVLTKRPSIPADRCTLLSRGRRSHHWDTGRAADKPCRSNRARRAPHSAIPGSRQCRHRPPWWGYTWPRFGIDTGCCSEVPNSRSRSLQAQNEQISEYFPRYRHITSNEF